MTHRHFYRQSWLIKCYLQYTVCLNFSDFTPLVGQQGPLACKKSHSNNYQHWGLLPKTSLI